jgi:glycogen operon protein
MADWGNPVALSLGYVLCGAAGEFYTRGGQRDIDESFLVMINAYHGDLDFQIPHLPVPLEWEALVDTAEPTGLAESGRLWKPGEAYPLRGHSFALFINRAPEPTPAAEFEIEAVTPPECSGPKEDAGHGFADPDAPAP